MTSQNNDIQDGSDWVKVDNKSKSIVFRATVTKNPEKAAVTKWGQRGQAWIGSKNGSEDKFFIFTTDIPRTKINEAIQELGAKYYHQISKEEWKKHTGMTWLTQFTLN